MYSGYPNDVNNSISFYDVYNPGGTVLPGNMGVPAGNNGAQMGNTSPGGGAPITMAARAANGKAEAAAAAATGGLLGQPITWWIGFLLTFGAFIFVARRYGGDDRYQNLRASLYNGVFLTFFIVLILSFLKVVAARFNVPGFSKLILAI